MNNRPAHRRKLRQGRATAPRQGPRPAAPFVELLEGRRLLAGVAVAAEAGDPPEVQAPDRAAPEGQREVIFEISVPAGDQDVSLDYATVPGTAAEGTDFTPVAGSLTFPAGPETRTQRVTVPLVDDAFWEEDEWFYLRLGNVANATLPGDAPTYRVTATVRDDDPRPTLRVSGPRVGEGDAGDVEAPFVVSLSAPQDRRITVDYATANGTAVAPADYAAAAGTLVFEPGEVSKSVGVSVHGDTADESNESFTLTLRAPVNAVLGNAAATATILEDDDRRPTANVIDVSPDPRAAAVDSVLVRFSEAVTGFDASDVTLTRDGGPNLLTGAETVASSNGVDFTLDNLGPVTRTAGRYTLTVRAAGSGVADAAGNAFAADAADGWRTYAAVAGRATFYNNSAFDGADPAANAADDAAVAPDKRALRPGESASFANVTGYTRGLNGVMVDLSGLPAGTGPGASDFELRAGAGGDGSAWPAAPAPLAVVTRRGVGDGASDRVTVTFADNAVRNTWLRVTVLANDRTGLSAPDVFYFGNLVGDTADRAGARSLSVDASDLLATRRGFSTAAPVPLTDVADHNRDGRVNAADFAAARNKLSRVLPVPAPAAAPAASSRVSPATALLSSTAALTADRRTSAPVFA